MDISTHTGYHTDTYRGTPYRIRTGVAAVKGQCPRPLDEGCIFGSGGENRTPIMGFGDPYTAIVLHRNVTAAPDVASKVPIEARTIVVTIYELARQCLLQF